MPFILKNKETEQYRLFGSLPILCRHAGFDTTKQKSLNYIFSQKKENKFKNEDFVIIKVQLERGGKKMRNIKKIWHDQKKAD